MRNCPFCGANDPNIQKSLTRMVCLDCGASGPMCREDPESAWDVRAELPFELLAGPQSLFDPTADDVTKSVRQALDRMKGCNSPISHLTTDDEIYVDGTLKSVRQALTRVFDQGRKMKS